MLGSSRWRDVVVSAVDMLLRRLGSGAPPCGEVRWCLYAVPGLCRGRCRDDASWSWPFPDGEAGTRIQRRRKLTARRPGYVNDYCTAAPESLCSNPGESMHPTCVTHTHHLRLDFALVRACTIIFEARGRWVKPMRVPLSFAALAL